MALQIAALGHDIERSTARKTKRQNYVDYNEFKKAHSRKSAKLLCEILSKYDLNQTVIDKITKLVMSVKTEKKSMENLSKDG